MKVVDYYPTNSSQETKKTNKQTNKQNNLLTLTISCEKKGCLIRTKKKNTKP